MALIHMHMNHQNKPNSALQVTRCSGLGGCLRQGSGGCPHQSGERVVGPVSLGNDGQGSTQEHWTNASMMQDIQCRQGGVYTCTER